MAFKNEKNPADCIYVIDRAIKEELIYPCYLLYGAEGYLRKQNFQKLLKYLADPADTMNCTIYQGAGVEVEKIIDLAETLPFFAKRRVIVLKDTGLMKQSNDLLSDYLNDQAPDTVFIFLEEEIDKRSRLYKQLERDGLAVEYVPQQEKILFAWMNARMKSVQKTMLDSVKGYLLDLTGENMELIDKELEKLIAYAWDRNEITLQDVKLLCPNQLEDQIFEMVKAISEKKQEQALKYYYELLGLKVAPIKILALINRQFQQILHLRDSKKKGLSESTIASNWGMRDFVVRNILSQSRNYDLNQVRWAFELGVQTDQDIKEGRITDQLAVELLILELSSEKQEKMA